MKLTKTVVDGLVSREAKYVVACSATRGLSLRVEPSGVKTYLFRYRTAEGKQKNLTLGRHGEITTEQARKLAEAARGEVVKAKILMAARSRSGPKRRRRPRRRA